MGSHSLLQGIFLTQGSNPDLLHCRQILYHLSHQNPTFTFRLQGEVAWFKSWSHHLVPGVSHCSWRLNLLTCKTRMLKQLFPEAGVRIK